MGYNNTGNLTIRTVSPRSAFYAAGVRKGDRITAINGQTVVDELDFRFFAASPRLLLDIIRNNRHRTLTVERTPGSFPEIEFYEKAIRRCANRCIFCFIDQMPRGLRRRLYIKDEDLTHSFLNGNYVTLTNAGAADLRRIVRIGLSPLFISVHATDPLVRSRMLGIRRASPIMEQLSFLAQNNIQFHTQIVVCPGYNDGAILMATVKDLFSLGPNLISIAVVPVGLTRFRAFPLKPVDGANAREICTNIGTLSDSDRSCHGKRRLFLADEFFLKACRAIPPAAYYEEYPQIENGVGLVRQLLDNWKTAKSHKRKFTEKPGRTRERYLLMTSCSAFPFLSAIADEAVAICPGAVMRAEPVANRFFGESVTVAGLLTARDVIRAIRKVCGKQRFDRVLLPAAMFNYAGYTLDGWSAKRIAKQVKLKVQVLDSIEELGSVK